MFANPIINEVTHIQYARINQNNIPFSHNPGFYKPFIGQDLLLLAEPVESHHSAIVAFAGEGAAIVYPNVFQAIEEMPPRDYIFYTRKPLTYEYARSLNGRDSIMRRGGVVAIQGFILNKIDMKELGKSKLERL